MLVAVADELRHRLQPQGIVRAILEPPLGRAIVRIYRAAQGGGGGGGVVLPAGKWSPSGWEGWEGWGYGFRNNPRKDERRSAWIFGDPVVVK